jgi:methylglutaconyl-CoA hydratase
MEHLSDLALAAAPGAVADAKALVRFVAGHKIDESLAKETARRIAQRRVSAEGKEGLAAFLEKRKPEWST